MTNGTATRHRKAAQDCKSVEVDHFLTLARSGSCWGAWGLFLDTIADREGISDPNFSRGRTKSLQMMWNATFDRGHKYFIGDHRAEHVAPLLWITVGRLCKYGHPMPENVTPADLKESVYVERRKEWRENFAAILGIEPGTVTLADLMEGA